jgi:hypothetical protein
MSRRFDFSQPVTAFYTEDGIDPTIALVTYKRSAKRLGGQMILSRWPGAESAETGVIVFSEDHALLENLRVALQTYQKIGQDILDRLMLIEFKQSLVYIDKSMIQPDRTTNKQSSPKENLLTILKRIEMLKPTIFTPDSPH